MNENGRVIWSEEVYQKLQKYIKKNRVESTTEQILESRDYKTTKINNRRYLGNKYKLLPFTTKVVRRM